MDGRPNILLIMCDQLNASVLGCYGGPVPTPNLDRLASEGVLFHDAVCPTPFCSPSRASLITGVYPHSHGIVHNVNQQDYPAIPSPPTEESIHSQDITTEKLLNSSGYDTHHYGKLHLNHANLPYYEDVFGEHVEYEQQMSPIFDQVKTLPPDKRMEWYGWHLPVEVSSQLQEAVSSLGDQLTEKRLSDFITKMGRLDWPLEHVFDVQVAERTIERLGQLGQNPFMLTCSFNYPHDPNVVPSPYYEMFPPESIEHLKTSIIVNPGLLRTGPGRSLPTWASQGHASFFGSIMLL